MGLFDFIFGSRSKRKGGKSDANGYQNVGKDSGNSSQKSNSQTQTISLKFNQIIKEEGLVCCYCSTLNKVCDNSILLFHQFSEYVDEDEKNEIIDGIKYIISLIPSNFYTNRLKLSLFNRHTIDLQDRIFNIRYNIHFSSDGFSWAIYENKEFNYPFNTPLLMKSSPGFLVSYEKYTKNNLYKFLNEIFVLIGYPTLTINDESRDEIKPNYSDFPHKSGEEECEIGRQYLTGKDKEIDEIKALRHFKNSAESGYGTGMYYYSYCLIKGKGTKENIKEGVLWLKKACEQQVPLAYELWGDLVDEGTLRPDNGFYSGNPYSEAFRLFNENAEDGNAEDIYHLALCYHYGKGVDKDENKAISLLKLAIDMGSEEACFELAILYLIGEGVTQSYKNHFDLMLKSAELGSVEALYQVGFCYEEGRGVSKDLKKAFDWYMKGAQKKHGFCQYKVGMFFLKGRGIEKDINSAVVFLNLAGEKGFKDAKNIVDQIISSDLNKEQ